MSVRLLVTGGAGLIGSALCERALRAGARVTALDDLSSGRAENLPRDPRMRLVVGDVCDGDLVRRLVRETDMVAHLAAGVGVRLVLRRPTGTLRRALLGAETVLRCAAAVRRAVFLASSSEVYGDRAGALCEDDALGFGPPSALRFSYAAGKAAGEALAFAYAHEYGLRVSVGRFFNVVGPRQRDDGHVLPRLVSRALAGEPLDVHGDGLQTRAFLDVHDAAEYVWRLLHAAKAGGVLVNVGREAPTTILDLARLVRAAAGTRAEIRFVDPDYGPGFSPIRHRRPDTRRLRALTGYSPLVRLEATVRACVAARRSASSTR